MTIETDEHGYIIPGTLPDPILEGHGVGNHLPRVTLRLTTQQLSNLIEMGFDALASEQNVGCDQYLSEVKAIREALDTVADHLANSPPFALADISIAPEVTFDD